MDQGAKRPTGATVVAILYGVFGSLALFTGSFWMSRSLLSREPLFSDMSNQTFAIMSLLSVIFGLLYGIAADRIWGRKTWAWQLGVVAGILGIILSVIAHIIAGGINLLSLSWVYPVVAVIALVILYLPDVKSYYTE
ncbi:MAG: hypothetical protein ACE5IO_03880 [Thermoplasmata archaeon]